MSALRVSQGQQNRINPQQQQQQQRPGSNNARQPPHQQQQQRQPHPHQQQQQQQQQPKISVSDAIALTTLRLGRVETFINSLPPMEDLIQCIKNNGDSSLGSGNDCVGGVSGGGSSNMENMRIVDEAVFTSIVSRLDKTEQSTLLNHASHSKSQTQNQSSITILSKSIEQLKTEMKQLKELFTELQSFVTTSMTNNVAEEFVQECESHDVVDLVVDIVDDNVVDGTTVENKVDDVVVAEVVSKSSDEMITEDVVVEVSK